MTICRQSDLGNIFGNVAGVAIEAAVRPRQRITRLRVVIKTPPHPTIWIVTERTIRPQATFMMLVAVAGRAIQRRPLEQQGAMTFLARYDGMAPNQRKSSDIVIEGLYLTPTSLPVTLLAAAAKLTLVPIILAVTRYTGRRQLVAIEIAGVALIALDLRVRASQREFRRPVVIETNRGPLVRLMAGLAFCTVPCGVSILNLVAIDARGANALVAFANMARRADDGSVCPLEPKLSLVVVEWFDATPSRLAVTIVARFPEASLVRFVHFMTVEAASGCVAVLNRWCVASIALNGLVSVTQFEIRERVIERFAIELHDVGFSPLVIGVAMVAFLFRRIRLTTMKFLN